MMSHIKLVWSLHVPTSKYFVVIQALLLATMNFQKSLTNAPVSERAVFK